MTTQQKRQSLTASGWPATSPAALRERIAAEQGTARTRAQILDRALLRAIRREG